MTLSLSRLQADPGEIDNSTRCRKTDAGAGSRQVTRGLTNLWSTHDRA